MSAETLPGPQPTDPHAEHRRPLPAGAPSRIGRYEVLREIGTGSFGRVYYAHDPRLRRYVAVKVPKEQLPPDRHEKFLEEGRTIAGILHENICPVYDADVDGEIPFIVMRYVAATLDEVLKRGQLAPERAIGFAIQVAHALDAAHAKGVIHRDLKPSNLLYDEGSGQLLLADFGIARFLDGASATTGGGKGTPLYMAPEQWDPQAFGEITARTDVYSLGALLYQMLAGVPPFEGTQYQLLNQHMNKHPVPLVARRRELDQRCDTICNKAMEKLPTNRFPTARAFAEALDACLRNAMTDTGVFQPFLPVARQQSRRPSTLPEGARVPNAGEQLRVALNSSVSMTFCWVPGGECQLGAPSSERALVAGLSEHERDSYRGTLITAGFWLAKYPVTQEEWYAVADVVWYGRGAGRFQHNGPRASALVGVRDTRRFPIENVSWIDCSNLLDRLNRDVAPPLGAGMRVKFALPHEDEWEYACRGGLGNHRLFYFGNELNGTNANCDGREPLGTTTEGPFLGRPTEVGSYEAVAPHPWGLCDMHGNVWEWCENLFEDTSSRVLRGGAWDCKAEDCRTARRFRSRQSYSFDNCGLRLCLRPC